MKNLTKLKNKFYFILVLIVFVLGFAVRLYKINNPVADWHSWRQADTASVSRVYFEEGIDILYPKYHDISAIQTGYKNPEGLRYVEFPVFNVVHAYLAQSDRFTFEVWGRLVSVVASVVAAFALFLLSKDMFGKKVALIAAFLFLFIPYNIYFSRVILPEPMGVMWMVLSWYFYSKFIKDSNYLNLFLGSAAFALTILVKPYAIFFGLPIIALVLRKYGIVKILKSPALLLSINLAIIPFFLWRGWINYGTRFIGIPHFAWAFNGDEIRFRPSFWYWIYGERVAKLILGMWGVVPFSLGLLANATNGFVLTSALGAFLYTSVVATANVRHDYYQVYIFPTICIFAALGFNWLVNKSGFNKIATIGFSFFVLFMTLLLGWYQIRPFYQVNHYEIVEAGMRVDELIPKEARIIAPYNGDTAFLYQTKRRGWPVIDRSIEELIADGATHFVSVNFDDDTNRLMSQFKTLERNQKFVILDLRERI